MRMVLNVAKAELRNLFYSPVAWFLAIAFLVQCGWYYTSTLYPLAKMQEGALEYSAGFKDFGPYPVTYLFFMMQENIYSVALQNLYLFVPLLCMGLMSREVNSGTIKLLYSSPIKLRQVILGKYLAIVIYNLLLVSIIGIFLITAVFNIRSADYGLLLSGTLAFFLLTCAYTAIGLFMSSLTSYQILSAVGTFIVIFILSRIGTLWQKIDFVRDLTYFLNLSGRTQRMLKGLIASKDVIYFAMVILMFLGFTLIRLRGAREAKPWPVLTIRTLAVIAITLTIGYICSLPKYTLYLDATAANLNTIHERTQHLAHEMDEPMEVTLYTNLLGEEATYGFPEARNAYITDLWEKYLRFKPDIKFNYVYYYYYEKSMDNGQLAATFPKKNNDEIARDMAKGFKVKYASFIKPDSIKKMEDMGPEGYRLVMKVKYKGRTEWLRTYKAAGPFPSSSINVWPDEQNVAAALKRLIHPEGIPKIIYTTGNLERSIYKSGEREYWTNNSMKSNQSAPINLGFDFDTLSLNNRDIPAGITALVVADPKSALSDVSRQKLRDYIEKGGNVIFMSEPGKQQMLNPLLTQVGVKVLDGTIVQPTYNEEPHKVLSIYTNQAVRLSDENMLLVERRGRQSGYRYDTIKVLMPGVAPLSVSDSSGFRAEPLLMSEARKSWIKKGRLVTDSAAVVFNAAEGDINGSFPTSLKLSRQVGNKEQRIAIYGDGDFMSNLRAQNGETISRSIYHWMSDGQYPIYLPRQDPKDNLLTVLPKTVKRLGLIYVWILPGLLLIAGTVLLIRRKRK